MHALLLRLFTRQNTATLNNIVLVVAHRSKDMMMRTQQQPSSRRASSSYLSRMLLRKAFPIVAVLLLVSVLINIRYTTSLMMMSTITRRDLLALSSSSAEHRRMMISIYIPCHVPLRLWKAPVVRAPRGPMRFVALAKQNFKGRFLSFITTGLRVRTTSVPNVRQTQCSTLTANCRMRNVWRK